MNTRIIWRTVYHTLLTIGFITLCVLALVAVMAEFVSLAIMVSYWFPRGNDGPFAMWWIPLVAHVYFFGTVGLVVLSFSYHEAKKDVYGQS